MVERFGFMACGMMLLAVLLALAATNVEGSVRV